MEKKKDFIDFNMFMSNFLCINEMFQYELEVINQNQVTIYDMYCKVITTGNFKEVNKWMVEVIMNS